MVRSRTARPRTRAALVPATTAGVADPAAARELTAIAGAVRAQEARPLYTPQVLAVDLIAGTLVIPHNLGRTPAFVSVAPSVADPSFAWALLERTDATVTLSCVGTSQPGALVEVR